MYVERLISTVYEKRSLWDRQEKIAIKMTSRKDHGRKFVKK